ncbi:DUF3800 domain-containing protein [Altererythrobacter confluentis]|uniref:DUF3800 domain-containing protein n=1 Tax=Allopontixanthobacter confluentis TaxID=1849021 RepID=A0A6L7GHQ2_9SPHN|nr:DUF3800 domain-containing protein [Allopontixanthobacter confluentis]
MPLEKLPPCGLHTFYADESDDKKTYIMTCVAVPTFGATADDVPILWNHYHTKAKEWRKGLKDHYNIPVGKELKGSKLATGRNSYDGGRGRLYGSKAIEAYRFALDTLDFLPNNSIFSVTCERDYKLYGHTRLEAVLYAMFQRIQRKCVSERLAALIFFDEGHAEYRRLYRKACVHLPTGSSQGNWASGASTKNVPLDRTIKDANFKDSKQSHFVQIADIVAYATLMKMRGEMDRLSDKEKSLAAVDLFNWIPKDKLNRKVDMKTLDGIKRLG